MIADKWPWFEPVIESKDEQPVGWVARNTAIYR